MISTCLLFSQTANDIKTAKKLIKQTGMSEQQARDAAKARGYTDNQINAVIRKEKEKSSSNASKIESLGNIGFSEFEKSNDVLQKEPLSQMMNPNSDEELPMVLSLIHI